jgi:hypothetical protein
MKSSRKTVIERVLMAIEFMERNRYWTIEDLSNHLGTCRRNGAKYVREMSIYLPIIEVKPLRYGVDGVGLLPIIFSLQKNNTR